MGVDQVRCMAATFLRKLPGANRPMDDLPTNGHGSLADGTPLFFMTWGQHDAVRMRMVRSPSDLIEHRSDLPPDLRSYARIERFGLFPWSPGQPGVLDREDLCKQPVFACCEFKVGWHVAGHRTGWPLLTELARIVRDIIQREEPSLLVDVGWSLGNTGLVMLLWGPSYAGILRAMYRIRSLRLSHLDGLVRDDAVERQIQEARAARDRGHVFVDSLSSLGFPRVPEPPNPVDDGAVTFRMHVNVYPGHEAEAEADLRHLLGENGTQTNRVSMSPGHYDMTFEFSNPQDAMKVLRFVQRRDHEFAHATPSSQYPILSTHTTLHLAPDSLGVAATEQRPDPAQSPRHPLSPDLVPIGGWDVLLDRARAEHLGGVLSQGLEHYIDRVLTLVSQAGSHAHLQDCVVDILPFVRDLVKIGLPSALLDQPEEEGFEHDPQQGRDLLRTNEDLDHLNFTLESLLNCLTTRMEGDLRESAQTTAVEYEASSIKTVVALANVCAHGGEAVRRANPSLLTTPVLIKLSSPKDPFCRLALGRYLLIQANLQCLTDPVRSAAILLHEMAHTNNLWQDDHRFGPRLIDALMRSFVLRLSEVLWAELVRIDQEPDPDLGRELLRRFASQVHEGMRKILETLGLPDERSTFQHQRAAIEKALLDLNPPITWRCFRDGHETLYKLCQLLFPPSEMAELFRRHCSEFDDFFADLQAATILGDGTGTGWLAVEASDAGKPPVHRARMLFSLALHSDRVMQDLQLPLEKAPPYWRDVLLHLSMLVRVFRPVLDLRGDLKSAEGLERLREFLDAEPMPMFEEAFRPGAACSEIVARAAGEPDFRGYPREVEPEDFLRVMRQWSSR